MVRDRCSKGQALVEFCIVAAGAIGFLLIFLPLLGKIGEVRFKTLQGARYGAWERTVFYDKASWKYIGGAEKTEIQIKEDGNRNVLAQSEEQIGAVYKSSLPIDSIFNFSNRKKFLTSSYEEFLVDQKNNPSGLPAYVSYRDSNGDAPKVGISLSGKALQIINLPILPSNGFYRSYSMIETKPLHWWKEFDQTIAPEDTNVILADGWSAGTGIGLQGKMKEGAITALNNKAIKPFNALSEVISLACIGIGVKCGRDLKSDRLSETSASPMYVPSQRLEK